MSKQAVRDVIKRAIEKKQIAGGARKPIEITELGAGILRSHGAAELATRGLNLSSHKKIQ